MASFGREAVANRVRPIRVSDADRAELERLQRASSAPAGLSRRARAVLLMAQGVSGVEIAARIGYTVVQGLYAGPSQSAAAALRRGRRVGAARTPAIGPPTHDYRPPAGPGRRPDSATAGRSHALDDAGSGP